MKRPHLFVAGVPCTGKTWLGRWLQQEKGYLHVDAEHLNGRDFDVLGIHVEWDEMLATLNASRFVAAIDALRQPVVVNWGFPPQYLPIVALLVAAGVHAWWLNASHAAARRAFVKRGDNDPSEFIPASNFDLQVGLIDSDWPRIEATFRSRIVEACRSDGSQRPPAELWSEMYSDEAGGAHFVEPPEPPATP